MSPAPIARSSRSGALTLGCAGVCALALHAAIPVMAVVAPRSARPLVAASSGAGKMQLIELDVVPIAPSLPFEAAPSTSPREEVQETPARAPAPRAAPAPSPDASPRAASGEPADAPSAPASEYDGPPSAVMVAPDGAPRPIWAIPGAVSVAPPAPAPTGPDAPRKVDRDIAGRVLREAQAERDKSIGIDLPAAGTVASTVALAVREVDTPQDGRASFEVRLGPNGQVLGVRVLSASTGASAAWDRAAAAARAKLAGRKLAMTGAYAAGAVVVVDISSKTQLPAGDGGGVSRPGSAPDRAGGKATFDLSNIGAVKSRVVSSLFRVSPLR